MSRNAFDAIESQYNEAEDYRATVKQEREMEVLRRDAERYRWLRANCVEGRMESRGPNPDFYLNCDEPENEWDAAIDAAMKEQK